MTQTVLLLEDDPDSAAVLALFLTDTPWQVEVVTQPQEALQRLSQVKDLAHYCAIIFDMFLPSSDGIEVLKSARQQAGTEVLPFIAVTAYHTPELRSKALSAGFDAYLPKPLNRQHLLDTLAQYCPM
jgi:CheY-like chemotaxis protein